MLCRSVAALGVARVCRGPIYVWLMTMMFPSTCMPNWHRAQRDSPSLIPMGSSLVFWLPLPVGVCTRTEPISQPVLDALRILPAMSRTDSGNLSTSTQSSFGRSHSLLLWPFVAEEAQRCIGPLSVSTRLPPSLYLVFLVHITPLRLPVQRLCDGGSFALEVYRILVRVCAPCSPRSLSRYYISTDPLTGDFSQMLNSFRNPF